MFVLTRMPDLSNPGFRARYTPRWGRETVVVCATAQTPMEYNPRPYVALSVKLMLSGEERYCVQGREKCVAEHSFLVLNGGQVYGSRIAERFPAYSLSVFFDPVLVAETGAAVRRSAADDLAAEPRREVRDFPQLPARLPDTLRSHATRLRALCESHVPERLAIEQLVLRLLIDLYRWLDGASRVAPGIDVRGPDADELHRRLSLVYDLIESCYADDLTLHRLAATAGLSRFHFLREYRKAFGRTPHEHVIQRRVDAAISLLRSTSLRTADIAAEVGFNSRQALSAQFSRRAGTSPIAYRRTADPPRSRDRPHPAADTFGVVDLGIEQDL
jgi:AraC-like DNA-binding protein